MPTGARLLAFLGHTPIVSLHHLVRVAGGGVRKSRGGKRCGPTQGATERGGKAPRQQHDEPSRPRSARAGGLLPDRASLWRFTFGLLSHFLTIDSPSAVRVSRGLAPRRPTHISCCPWQEECRKKAIGWKKYPQQLVTQLRLGRWQERSLGGDGAVTRRTR